MAFNEDRLILNLTDSQLEDLTKKWPAKAADTYTGFERPTASADMGRVSLQAKAYPNTTYWVVHSQAAWPTAPG